jgi:hypothetical protein
MSLATEMLEQMPVLQQRMRELYKAAHPFTYTVFRDRTDGFIGFLAHREQIKSCHPDLTILGDFDNKPEMLEFIKYLRILEDV